MKNILGVVLLITERAGALKKGLLCVGLKETCKNDEAKKRTKTDFLLAGNG